MNNYTITTTSLGAYPIITSVGTSVPDPLTRLCKNVFFDSVKEIVSHVYVYNERVVKCQFRDGTTQKAVLHADDTFDLETGISICVTKYLLEKLYGCFGDKSGTYLYNHIIKHALKTMEDDKAIKEKKQKEAERLKNIRKKKEAKKRRREEERMRRFAKILKEQVNGESDN